MQTNGINYIAKIEALSEVAPSFFNLVSTLDGTFVEYEVDGGFSVGNGLCHDGDCAIQKNFVTGGSIFPTHTHDEFEYIIILEGEGEVVIDDVRSSFQARDCIVIKPGQSHTWVYTKHTKMIGITIPASKGYPHGKG